MGLDKRLLKIGVAGFGHIGKVHVRVFDNLNGINTIQVADPTGSKDTEEFRAISKKDAFFKDYKKLDTCDAVVVALPAELQKEAIFYFSSRRIPMLIEKPMGVTYSDSLKIVEILEREQVPAMCGLTGLYHPEFKAMYSQLSSIGDLKEVRERLHEANPDLGNLLVNEGRGVLNLNGVHILHRFYKIASLKDENKRLKVTDVNLGHKYFMLQGEDFAEGELHLGDVPFKFSMSFRNGSECDNGLPIDYVVEVEGTRGKIVVTGWEKCETYYNDGTVEVNYKNLDGPLERNSQYSRIGLGLREEGKEFLRFLKSEETQHHTLKELLEGKELVENCYN